MCCSLLEITQCQKWVFHRSFPVLLWLLMSNMNSIRLDVNKKVGYNYIYEDIST